MCNELFSWLRSYLLWNSGSQDEHLPYPAPPPSREPLLSPSLIRRWLMSNVQYFRPQGLTLAPPRHINSIFTFDWLAYDLFFTENFLRISKMVYPGLFTAIWSLMLDELYWNRQWLKGSLEANRFTICRKSRVLRVVTRVERGENPNDILRRGCQALERKTMSSSTWKILSED